MTYPDTALAIHANTTLPPQILSSFYLNQFLFHIFISVLLCIVMYV